MQLKDVPIDVIREPEFDVRDWVSKEGLDELADSITARGLEYPIRVFKKDGQYEIQDGHRRFLACRIAGLATIPCLVIDTSDDKNEMDKLTCNLHREDLSAIEKGKALKLLRDKYGYSMDDLSRMLGVNKSRVCQLIGLDRFSEPLLEALENKVISEHVARELNRIPDITKQEYYLQYIINGGATIDTVKNWVRKELADISPPTPPINPFEPSNEITDIGPPRIQCRACQRLFRTDTLVNLSVCMDCKAEIDMIIAEMRALSKEDTQKKTRGSQEV